MTREPVIAWALMLVVIAGIAAHNANYITALVSLAVAGVVAASSLLLDKGN